jgi:hypothetical protein
MQMQYWNISEQLLSYSGEGTSHITGLNSTKYTIHVKFYIEFQW